MKLKELVANSLPRVRGKKKKSPALVNCPIPSPGARTHAISNSLPASSQHLPLSSPASAVLATASLNEDVTPLQQGRGREHRDNGSNFSTFFPAGTPPNFVKDDPQNSGLTWHGNALYKGIHSDGGWQTASEKVFSSEMISSKTLRNRRGAPSYGMTTSHSAEGISAHHLFLMSRSGCDARMALSEYGGSCSSQMSVISESALEAYSSALQQRQPPLSQLNAHYHHHSHQHYHHYHHHHHVQPSRAMPLKQQPQPGQQPYPGNGMSGAPNINNNGIPTYAVPHAAPVPEVTTAKQKHHKQTKEKASTKQELGFFRKSFASFRSMRKPNPNHNNNTLVSPPHVKAGCVAPLTKANLEASEHLRCSVCPYPDQGGVTAVTSVGDRKIQETRPTKTKRKGLKGFSKSKRSPVGKENKGEFAQPGFGDNSSWFSDNDAQSMIVAVGQPITDPVPPDFYPSWDRDCRRECSVDSFSSSRVNPNSREGSCIRELDASGFDSASLSGYESDFPRGTKAYRSRSRIRTNPWLPSPQPSLGIVGGCRRGDAGGNWQDEVDDLRESQEDMIVGDLPSESFKGKTSSSVARSASFEHHRPEKMVSMTSSYHADYHNPPCRDTEAASSASKRDMSSAPGKDHGMKTNQRPLTPNVDPDSLMTMSLDRPVKSPPPAVAKKSSWWNLGRRGSKKESIAKDICCTSIVVDTTSRQPKSSKEAVCSAASTAHSNPSTTSNYARISKSSSNSHALETTNYNKGNECLSNNQDRNEDLNDLNMDTGTSVLKSRPSSIVSPNSEFVVLAGHLEQLAHNISFEYEDALNVTIDNNSSLPRNEDAAKKNTAQSNERKNGNIANSSEPGFENSLIGISEDLQKNASILQSDTNLVLQTPESPFSSNSGCSISGSVTCISSSNSNTNTAFLISSTAHSPDSGIGGLGSTDGDEVASSSNADRTPEETPQGDQTTLLCLGPDALSEGAGVSNRCTDSKNTSVTCGSSSGARPKTLVKYLTKELPGHKHLLFQNSISSGHDDDSSATVSESDVDNTHYYDGSVMADESRSSAVSNSFYERNSLFQKCKAGENSHGFENIDNNSKGQLQTPVSHRPGIVMGARATILEHSSHADQKGFSSRQSDNNYLGQTGLKGQSAVSRPSALKTSRSNSCDPQVHLIERSVDGICESNDSATVHPTLPQNITESASIESPSGCPPEVTSKMVRTFHLDASMILEANLKSVPAPPLHEDWHYDDRGRGEINKDTSKDVKIGSNKNLPPRIACSNDDEDKISQTTEDMASAYGESSLMDCSGSSRGDDMNSLNASFNMNDACVQTDFDEDFSCWDETDALEMLEGNALDPAESTRRWLLTGNMQGSADTGYSSQARESQVFMDEETMQVVDDMAGEAASQGLFRGDRSSGHSSDEKTPRNSGCFEADLDLLGNQILPSFAMCASLEEGPILYRPTAVTSFQHENPSPFSKQTKPAVAPKPRREQTLSISPAVVDQMFSNIEQQFQEIFRQRHSQRSRKTSDPKRFSGSSDSTLESEASADSSFSGGMPVGELHDVAARCREVETRTLQDEETKDNHLRENDHNHLSTLESNKLIGPKTKASSINQHNTNKKPAPAVAKKPYVKQNSYDRPVNNLVGGKKASDIMSSSKAAQYNQSTSFPVTEKADYLEFLRDAPLNRSNLKRPLFLVPGVGPVDISCSQNVTMFSDAPCKSPQYPHLGSVGAANGSSESSPTTIHFGKKLKYKNRSSKNLSTKPTAVPTYYNVSPMLGGNSDCLDKASSQAYSTSEPHRGRFSYEGRPTNARVEKQHRNAGGVQRESQNHRKTKQDSSMFYENTSKDVKCDESWSPHPGPEMDEDTRAIAARVASLKREKDDVYRRLQAAQLNELSKKGNLKELRRHAQCGQKEALLGTLCELRDKLENQKRKLQTRESSGDNYETF
ncbi:hypothetical protein PoB_001596200 [Plakobranchus ocellatus]|uniref:Uncharacterized protein n=1 Tax=Plakobranchus ocellatus TaxID=259542 RepID=A0AAV3Z4H8_9GAST|nr:hypothetical protein PoB_001596200 [Plakobranchus ocellatus]